MWLQELYQTLGVTEDCEDEALRLAFVYLAKRFHPDSGTPEADAVRFSEVTLQKRAYSSSNNFHLLRYFLR